MDSLFSRIQSRGRGLLGTWVKLPSFETVQLLAHAGFEFVVIDMEHAPHTLERAIELIFCAQSMGMAALARLPDQQGSTIQPLLDGGADGLMVPRVADLHTADEISRRMVFTPEGARGLGATSRAGLWGRRPLSEYIERGAECGRIIQLEDWESLENAAAFAALEHVNGIFIGHGDLFLSSGKSASDPAVRELTGSVLASAKVCGVLSGVAVGSADEARVHLDMGFSLVMMSNDATIFGRAAAEMTALALPPLLGAQN